MSDYSELLNAWKYLYDCYYYESMPFFSVVLNKFYKNNNKNYITPEEMKKVIVQYKNALNEYKRWLLVEIDVKKSPHQKKYFYLRKKIQSEYERLLQIYDDLLNEEDMTNGLCYKKFTRTTKKIGR